jgi:DNA-3-methyladenine glycosylase
VLDCSNHFQPLARTFFEPSAEHVAPRLLGHWLVRKTAKGPVGGPIVETEAYLVGDAACHAAPGVTQRNRVMFGPPGIAYIYFIYGCHFCFNVVCLPEGTAEAVLIRAIEAVEGIGFMQQRRSVTNDVRLTNGPGKLCQAMKIDRRVNGMDLCDPASELFLAENPQVRAFRRQRGPVRTTVRIGITRAAELPLRFYLDGSLFVSGRRTARL